MSWGSHQSLPNAILHIDGDSFFASCEMALDPTLKGKPLVTGAERGMVSSMNYEARQLGIRRAHPMHEIKKKFPQVIIKSSSYETYSLFSQRMFNIVRRYTPTVEEYSIDECFADLTGLRRALRMPYLDMAKQIKHDLQSELGMTFSIGLAPSKVLAKVASSMNKPDGLTVVPMHKLDEYLSKVPIYKVWGIGPQTSAHLSKYGIDSAYKFVHTNKNWIDQHLTKPHQELWAELQGDSIYKVDQTPHTDYQSIGKTKTFTPPSTDRTYVISQLSKNIENACIKARRYGLYAQGVGFFFKTQKFRYHAFKCDLPVPSNNPVEIIRHVSQYFDRVYKSKTEYRATGVTLFKLTDHTTPQMDLFGAVRNSDSLDQVFQSVDKVSKKYGKHTVFLGSSFQAMQADESGQTTKATPRRDPTFKGETQRKHVGLPMLGEVR